MPDSRQQQKEARGRRELRRTSHAGASACRSGRREGRSPAARRGLGLNTQKPREVILAYAERQRGKPCVLRENARRWQKRGRRVAVCHGASCPWSPPPQVARRHTGRHGSSQRQAHRLPGTARVPQRPGRVSRRPKQTSRSRVRPPPETTRPNAASSPETPGG